VVLLLLAAVGAVLHLRRKQGAKAAAAAVAVANGDMQETVGMMNNLMSRASQRGQGGAEQPHVKLHPNALYTSAGNATVVYNQSYNAASGDGNGSFGTPSVIIAAAGSVDGPVYAIPTEGMLEGQGQAALHGGEGLPNVELHPNVLYTSAGDVLYATPHANHRKATGSAGNGDGCDDDDRYSSYAPPGAAAAVTEDKDKGQHSAVVYAVPSASAGEFASQGLCTSAGMEVASNTTSNSSSVGAAATGLDVQGLVCAVPAESTGDVIIYSSPNATNDGNEGLGADDCRYSGYAAPANSGSNIVYATPVEDSIDSRDGHLNNTATTGGGNTVYSSAHYDADSVHAMRSRADTFC